MTRLWKVLAVWIGLYGLAYAQPQTRLELIHSARAEKEANLTPEAPPKAERQLVRIENSRPFRIPTEDGDGFAVTYGGILPGWGFAIAPRYMRNNLSGGRLNARAELRAATNRSYLGRLDLSPPRIFNDPAFLKSSATHRDISEMPHYGSGPQSRKIGRSDYRMEDTNPELCPGVRVFKGLPATAIGSSLAVNIRRNGGQIQFNWRARDPDPTSGGKYAAQYVRYRATDFDRHGFLRLDLDASQSVPLFNRTHVIALHGASSLTSKGSNQVVPFYLQPTLDGPDTFQRCRLNRFYGDNSTVLNAGYRWDASPGPRRPSVFETGFSHEGFKYDFA